MSQQIGFAAEKQARQFLLNQGLTWITSNYHCRWGEIDLIMREKDYLIFVEVRSRVSEQYGGAIASITSSKLRKIVKTATYYMTTKKLLNDYSARFDVISIQGVRAEIEWIKNAFDADYN